MAARLPTLSDDDPFVRFVSDRKLDRGRPLRDQVYRLLREAIVTGLLAPRTPINEGEIAQRIGISRTPVREAVKQVSDEGLVEVFAQNGTFVSDIRRGQVEQAYIIRIALEHETVIRAAEAITREQLQELEDCVNAHELALRRERFNAAIRHDDAFHRGIAEVKALDVVWKVIDISKAQMDRCRFLSLPAPGTGFETLRQHRAILAALAAHDVDGAALAMRSHLETSMSNTFALLDSLDRAAEE